MSDSILDLSGLGLEDTFEPTTVAPGNEYKLRIISFTSGTDKNGNAYIMPFFEVVDDPYCKEFGDYLPLPNESAMDPKTLNRSKLRMNNFLEAFGLSGAMLDMNEAVGSEGWAILGMGKDMDGEPQNKINKYVAGR